MISYSTNWMGPVSMEWFRERGLTETVREVLDKDQKYGKLKKGDVWEYEVITENYAAGRIDIRDDTKYGYDGWNEYGLPPMRTEDWNALSEFLWDFETEELLSFEDLIAQFEKHYGKKIRWIENE